MHKNDLLLLSFLFCVNAGLCAQEAPAPVYYMAPFYVSSYWFDEGEADSLAALYGSGTFQGEAPQDLSSVLHYALPEVGIIRKAGTSNDIVLRGLSQDDINVTIDGRKVYNACPNRMDPPVSHVSMGEVAYVEVTQGAFDLSRSGSMGGAINIRTDFPQEAMSKASLQTTYGSYQQWNQNISFLKTTDSWGLLFSGNYQQGDPYEDALGQRLTDMPDATAWRPDDYLEPYRDDVAYEMAHVSAKLAYTWDDSQRIIFSARYREDTDILYPGLRMDADSTCSHEFGLLYQVHDLPMADLLELNLYQNKTDHEMSDSRRVSSEENAMGMSRPAYVLDRGWYMESIAFAETTGFNVDADKSLGAWQLDYGIEILRRDWDIDNRLGAGNAASDASAEIFNDMIPDTRAWITGFYTEWERPLSECLSIEMGLRLDAFQTKTNEDKDFLESQRGAFDTAKDTEWSGKFVGRWQVSKRLNLFSGLGSVARIPNGRERYIQLERPGTMVNWLGNPDLKPARNNEWSMGAEWKGEGLVLRGKLFHSWLKDFIYIGYLTPADDARLNKNTRTYFNIDARLWGGDVSAEIAFAEHWALHLGASMQKGEKAESLVNSTDDSLAELPPLMGYLDLSYQKSDYYVRMGLDAADRQSDIDEDLNEESLGGYVVVHASGGYRFESGVSVDLAVYNLFDKFYAVHNAQVSDPFSSYTVVNEPGRSVFLTLGYEF